MMYKQLPSNSRYFISDEGLVFAYNWGEWDDGTHGHGVREMTQIPNKKGYLRVRLKETDGVFTAATSRLVLETFLGSSEYLEANHKNNNRQDNRLSNLEWTTHIENVRQKALFGTNVFTDTHRKNISNAKKRKPDEQGRYRCSGCKFYLEPVDFYVRKNRNNVPSSECKSCNKQRRKRRYNEGEK